MRTYSSDKPASPPQEAKPKEDAASRDRRRLLDYLPAIYQETSDDRASRFVGQLLTPFEKILLGGRSEKDSEQKPAPARSLEEEVAALPELFDPWETPKEFLPWLASWAALSFRSDLSEARRRKLLANIIPLYRIRGTRRYLEDLLQLCVEAFAAVSDAEIPEFQIGDHSTLGVDAYIGGGPPHFFTVALVAPKLSREEMDKQIAIARSVIDLAKPAHTMYELSVSSPKFEVGLHSRVGIDTVLGAPES
jgi:phage tail-like protein